MKLKDKECWIELYDIAKKIQEIEPWKYLWDMDLLAYVSKQFDDVFYCSVFGRAGQHRAVSIYQRYQIENFFRLADNTYPPNMLINYQECIMCNFSTRQDTLPENREIIKELGLKFRGTWISFECYQKGYEPSTINIEQVKMMTELLQNFYMMFRALIEQKMKVDFEGGEMLVRHYDEKRKLYVNYPQKLMIPKQEFDVRVEMPPQIEETIKKLPQTEMEFEYEFLNYIPIRIRDKKEKDGRRYYPRLRFLAEKESGIIIQNDLIDKNNYKNEQEYILESMDILVKWFFKAGRPKRIYVRDEETKQYLKGIAEKADIKINIKSKLKVIDEAYKMFERM